MAVAVTVIATVAFRPSLLWVRAAFRVVRRWRRCLSPPLLFLGATIVAVPRVRRRTTMAMKQRTNGLASWVLLPSRAHPSTLACSRPSAATPRGVASWRGPLLWYACGAVLGSVSCRPPAALGGCRLNCHALRALCLAACGAGVVCGLPDVALPSRRA